MTGVFPCVSLSGGLGTLAVRQGDPRVAGWLVVYRFPYADPEALTELARFPLPAGSPCFPGLYVLNGQTWLAYHDGQRQRLLNMATGDEIIVHGLSNPSAFGAGFWAYTEPWAPYLVHRINLRTDQRDQPRLGAPTGLSRILEDGSVVTIDEDRHALPGATIPSFAGPLAVGEGPDGGAVWTHTSGARGTLYKGRDSFTPKCAADGDILAITTAGPDVRLFCGTLAQLQRERGPIVNQPEVSVSVPDYERRVAVFLAPRLQRFDGDEERTRAHSFNALNDCARDLHQDDPNVGLLEKLGGDRVRDRAADILLYRISPSEAQVIDVIGDAEGHDGTPRPGWSVKDIRPIAQWKPPYGASVDPPPVVPPPQPPAQPPVDPGLVARIVALEAAQKQDRGSIEALEQVVVPLTQLPLNLAKLDEALQGYEVSGDTNAKGTGRLRHSHSLTLAITRKR